MAKAWRQKRWVVAPAWAGRDELARRLRTSPLVAQILYNRGLQEEEPIRRFLSPKLTDLHPPELLAHIDVAAERLCLAARQGRPICIYGDYDVDGMTGTAILYRCLAMFGANVSFYVPHRLEEGYGVNTEAVEKIAADGAKLLVTVDCGISAHQPLARARQLGMEVIVTDHHAPDATLPEVDAIVHPALPAGSYPNPDLSGSGVALKLAWQLARTMTGRDKVDDATREFLIESTSLAALGVIADVVPLVGENRVLAVYGLKGLAATRHVGIRALLEATSLAGEKLDAYHVGFCLAPRLNACGRMGHAQAALELLARADAAECRSIARHLEEANAQRQKIERDIAEQAAAAFLAGRLTGPEDRAVVVASPDWHAGVVGIVASRLVERFGRPAVVLTISGDEAHGSGRSISGLHMRDALAACGHCLRSFGGHAMAGGVRLAAKDLPTFARSFAEHAAAVLKPEDIRPQLRIDAEAAVAELGLAVVDQIQKLAPFGQGNPRPIVALRRCRILTPPTRMGRTGSSLSMLICQEQNGSTSRIRCVGFGMGELADALAGMKLVDVAGEPVLNQFNGRISVELHLRDVAILA